MTGMTDWKRGGQTGSLNGWVCREIREHFRDNAAARRGRYSHGMRVLHRIFDGGTFWRFIAIYATVATAIGIIEVGIAAYRPLWLPQWTAHTDIKPFLTNVASYLITAQVGVLGVVSIAIGLVTIIAQRENASTDVQIYYHESLAFGVVASSLALLAVLCIQLLWPIQFAVHWVGHGTPLLFFKILLTTSHIAWLLLNLAGLAHFVATTFAFVQQSEREGLRERYTANMVLPLEMRKRLRQQLYMAAGPEFVQQAWPTASAGQQEPTVYLGAEFSGAGDVEIPIDRDPKLVLADVRMAWVQWAITRWLRRCAAAPNQTQVAGLTHDPLLLFPPRLDETPAVNAGLCRRRGGLPLTETERLALRWAFKFRRKRDEA